MTRRYIPVKLEKTDSCISVFAPYDKEFPADARKLQGEWKDEEKAWTFPLDNEAKVRELLERIYGTDGSDTLIDVVATATTPHVELRAGVDIEGFEVCRASGRDQGARTRPGVFLREGVIDGGGTQYQWSTKVELGAVFYIEEFPARLMQRDLVGWDIQPATSQVKLAAEICRIDRRIEDLKTQKAALENLLLHSQEGESNY